MDTAFTNSILLGESPGGTAGPIQPPVYFGGCGCEREILYELRVLSGRPEMRRDYRDWDAVMLWSGIGFILILWSTSIPKALTE